MAASTITTTLSQAAATTTATTTSATIATTATVTLTMPAGAGSIEVRGTWTLKVVSGEMESLVNNPDMITAVQLAVASQVGVEPDLVALSLSVGSASRRLRGVVAGTPAGGATPGRTGGATPRRLEGVIVA